MATSKNVGGKVIYLRETVREQMEKPKTSPFFEGYDKLPDSEFAEVL